MEPSEEELSSLQYFTFVMLTLNLSHYDLLIYWQLSPIPQFAIKLVHAVRRDEEESEFLKTFSSLHDFMVGRVKSMENDCNHGALKEPGQEL